MYPFLILYINDIRRRFWSRIIIIIILLLLLFIIAGIIAAVIYLTRIKTNNADISCSIKLSLFPFLTLHLHFTSKMQQCRLLPRDFPVKALKQLIWYQVLIIVIFNIWSKLSQQPQRWSVNIPVHTPFIEIIYRYSILVLRLSCKVEAAPWFSVRVGWAHPWCRHYWVVDGGILFTQSTSTTHPTHTHSHSDQGEQL
jgi:hypothetical protein